MIKEIIKVWIKIIKNVLFKRKYIYLNLSNYSDNIIFKLLK